MVVLVDRLDRYNCPLPHDRRPRDLTSPVSGLVTSMLSIRVIAPAGQEEGAVPLAGPAHPGCIIALLQHATSVRRHRRMDMSDRPDLDALRLEFGERLGAIEAKIDALRQEVAGLVRLMAARAPISRDEAAHIWKR